LLFLLRWVPPSAGGSGVTLTSGRNVQGRKTLVPRTGADDSRAVTTRQQRTVDVMDGLTLRYELRSGTTTVTVEGSVDAQGCETLRDGLGLAQMLRRSGPIVIDLDRVDRLALAALMILREARDEARRRGRELSVRNLHQENVTDPGSIRILAGTP
jgi:anti-anti-sigma regulatory factor